MYIMYCVYVSAKVVYADTYGCNANVIWCIYLWMFFHVCNVCDVCMYVFVCVHVMNVCM